MKGFAVLNSGKIIKPLNIPETNSVIPITLKENYRVNMKFIFRVCYLIKCLTMQFFKTYICLF